MANTQDEKFTVIGHYRGNDYSDAVVDGVIKGEFDVYLPNADEETFAVLVEAIDADSAEQYVLEGRDLAGHVDDMSTRDALSLGIFAINTALDPTASEDSDYDRLIRQGPTAAKVLVAHREALDELRGVPDEDDAKISEGIDDLVEQGRTARHNATQPSETPEVTE